MAPLRRRIALALSILSVPVLAGRAALAMHVTPPAWATRGAGQVAVAGRSPRLCCTMAAGGDALTGIVWRGLEFARSPSLQPWFETLWGAASLEASAALAVDGSWADQSTEIGYTISTPAGTVALRGASEIFPRAEIDVASPVIEVAGEYTGPARAPVRLLVARNVVHDPDAATFAELGLSHEWSTFAAEVFVDAALNESDYYDARAGDVLQAGLGVSRDVRLSERLALSASGAAIYSPAHRRGWLVAALGFSLPLRAPSVAAIRSSADAGPRRRALASGTMPH